MASYREERATGAGWLVFAGIILATAGVFNIIDGIVALSKSSFYVRNATYVFSDLNTWGWIILILGIIQVIAAFGIYSGATWARWFGIGICALNAIGQLLFLPAYPWWSISMFALDILVIYGLAAYGGTAEA
jgi:hypothetical protein